MFLTAEQVHERYRLSRTAGYELTGGALKALQCAPGRWRLADLHALEDARAGAVLDAVAAAMAGQVASGAAGEASTEASGLPMTPETDLPCELPTSRRGRRRTAA